MMKIAFLLDSFGMGGSERTALILIKLLQEYINISFSLIILAKKDRRISKKSYQIPKGIETYYIFEDNYSSIKKLLLTPVALYRIKKILMGKNVTHIVSFHDYSNLINVLLKKTLNHKAVTSERKYSKNYFGSRNKYMKYFLRYVFNESDVVIVNNVDIKNSLQNDYQVKSKIEILNNLINIEDFSNYSSTKEKDKITFITIGRLSNEKNTKDILYSFSKIKKDNYFLQIIGDGSNRKYLEELSIKLGIEKQVKFLGQVNNVFYYLSNADIFVFTSLTEGFPNVVLEAMYAKLPIISYKFKAGISSILDNGKYGIMIEIGDIKSFSKQMEFLATHKEKRLIYSNLSFERAKKYIDKNAYLSKFLEILKD